MSIIDIKIKSLLASCAWLIATGSLLGLTSCASTISEPKLAETELCNSPEISSLAKPKSACRVELIRYREAGLPSRNATLASVSAGLKANSDVIQAGFLYFLKVPGVGVVSLGESFNSSGAGYLHMYSAIEYDGASGGGISGKDHLFYNWLIERQGDSYCYVIAMRPPFTGELFDCPGKAISGTLGYEPGALTQKQVAQQMCSRFAAERGTRCEHNVVYPVSSVFERDAESKGRYRVTVERSKRGGRPPHDYRELRVYLVSVDGKNMEEVSRTWQECIPNSGCPSLPGPPSGEN